MYSDSEAYSYFFRLRLQEALDTAGLSGKDLEDMGVISASSVHEYVDCGRMPNLRTACRLAEVLNVSLDWLCGMGEELTWGDKYIIGVDLAHGRNAEEDVAPWLK